MMKSFSKNLQDYVNMEGVCTQDFKLLNISYIQAADDPSWVFPMHSHERGIEISIILKGRGVLYFNGIQFDIKENDILITDEQSIHSEQSDPENPIEQITMLFDGIQYRNRPANCIISEGMSPVINASSIHVIRSMAFHIRHLCLEERDYKTLHELCKAFVQTVCSNIEEEPEDIYPKSEYDLIRNVREYVDHHYSEDLSLKGVAALFYVDHYHLAHRFKDITGYSFKQYIINRRMGEAERMLLFEDRSMEEISRLTGYANLQYFYTSFRKYVGCTPAEFRNLYR